MDPTPIDPANLAARQGTGLEDSTLVISALSRPLEVGTLYNARTDQLIPGVTLWKTEDMKSKTNVTSQPNTRWQVSGSETLSEKTTLLDVTASVKGSFLCGLLDVEGSAHYLNSKTSSTYQCRTTLKYNVTTEFRELMISELGEPRQISETDATHVVTQVLYGADALMEFQETANDESTKQDIEGTLKVMIGMIPGIEISGDGSLNMTDEEKEKVKNFHCKFYGDFQLGDLPSTFEEAVKVYKELPSLLGEKGEKAVPVKVWLYPLSKLDSTESKLKRVISETLLSEVEKAVDDFHQAKIRSNDLLKMSKQIKAEDIVTKLEQFQNSLWVFTVEFLQKISDQIPAIRGGEKEESDLTDSLKSLSASGFGGKEMEQWLDGKQTEIDVVTMNLKKMNYEIKAPGSELDSYLMDPDVTDAFVFSFTSLSCKEPYLEKISKAAENFKSGVISSVSEQDPVDPVPWYLRQDVKKTLSYSILFFNTTPFEKKVISYITDLENPGVSVYWCRSADPTNPPVKINCELTLDPNTINQNLRLRDGNRTVENVYDSQLYPDHPDRFVKFPQVLSRESLPRCCYWECEWTGLNWIAVAYKSIDRKNTVFGQSEKAWALWCEFQMYMAIHNKKETKLSIHPPPPIYSPNNRIGVHIDTESGTLSFYQVSSEALTHLYTFNTTFTDEPLHAAFFIYATVSLVKITDS